MHYDSDKQIQNESTGVLFVALIMTELPREWPREGFESVEERHPAV